MALNDATCLPSLPVAGPLYDWLEKSTAQPKREASDKSMEKKLQRDWVELLRCIIQWTLPEESLLTPWEAAKQKRLAAAKQFVEERYPHVADRLEYLRNIEASSDQQIIIQGAFNQAYVALYEIAQMAKDLNMPLEEPYTFGTPDDGVQFEWRRGEREFHLEIIPNKLEPRYGYLLCPSLDLYKAEEGEFVGPLYSSPIIAEFLSWVVKGWL
jgi:hypothetical protein